MSRSAKASISPDTLKAILGHAEMTVRYARDALGLQSVWDMAAAAGAAAEREKIRRLADDCGATGRGADGPAEPFSDLIDRYFATPRQEVGNEQ